MRDMMTECGLCKNRFIVIAQILSVLSILLACSQVFAHEDPFMHYIKTFTRQPFAGQIVTDRPSFSVGPDTIPQGRVQLEAGYTFSLNRSSQDTATHTFPESLIRIGLSDQTELRLEWPTQTYVKKNKRVLNELRDLAIGFKTKIFQQKGLRPQLSLAGRLLIPTGGKNVTSGQVDPEFQLILNYVINHRFSLISNLNVGSNTFQRKRVTQFAASLGLGVNLRNDLSAFFEYYGIYPTNSRIIDTHFVQTGLVYQAGYHVQFDIRIGTGISGQTADILTGAGASWRF